MTNLTYRDYRSGDETGILALFKRVFCREMSPSFWRWRYRENPYGQGIMRLAMDGDKMVGHFGVIPQRAQFNGIVYPDVFPMTAMTDPDYTGQGIYTKLMSQTYETARLKGFPLVYGFFNMNSYYPSVKFGYHDVRKMDPLVKKLSFDGRVGQPDGNIVAVGDFDGAFDRLWDSIKADYKAIAPRTSELLNWRFVQDPVVDYGRFAYRDSNGEVLGYIVLKIYREGEVIRGHIVDLMSAPDESVVRALVNKSYGYFRANKATDLSGWFTEGTLAARVLESEGFRREPGVTNFAVMVLDKSKTELLPAENSAAWYLTMGDSDVY